MFSIQHLETQTTSDNSNLQKMYCMNYSTKIESTGLNMDRPKKENIFRSTFNAAMNMFGEQFSRVLNSLASNANNSLSVTVVQNEGIISPEFFKSLTTRRDVITTNDCICNKRNKEIRKLTQSLPNIDYHGKSSMSQEFDKKGKINTGSMDYIAGNFCTDEYKMPIVSMHRHLDLENFETIKDRSIESNKKENSAAKLSNETTNTIVHRMSCKNEEELGKVCSKVENESLVNPEEFQSTEVPEHNKMEIIPMHDNVNILAKTEEDSQTQTVISDLLKNMWGRLMNRKGKNPCGEVEMSATEVAGKRSQSQKQRRKLNTVAKGRGRGRAKSQLRRSGVSQNTVRKEQIKHAIFMDIQDDYETWQDFDFYEEDDSDNYEFNEINFNVVVEGKESNCSLSLTINDALKPKENKNVESRATDVPSEHVDSFRGINKNNSDYEDDWYVTDKNDLRPRLVSESSVESDDSYCVVFETGSDINCTSDFDEDELTDEDIDSEDDVILQSTLQKVKFNLKPTIHTMVQWDYAYRAARKGPWEEMARDRERFRSRINCIERILKPILTMQHRFHVWQERFADDK